MNVQRGSILGVLLFAAACTQTPVSSPPAKVGGPRPAAVRAFAGSVWVGASAVSEPRSAWPLPSHGEVAELDVFPLGSSGGFLVTFRQGGARWQGYLDPQLHAVSELETMDETPKRVTLAVSGAPQE